MKAPMTAQDKILVLLAKHTEMYAGEMAAAGDISHRSIYAFCQRMEARGLVRSRVESESGKGMRKGAPRKYYILTLKGHRAFWAAAQATLARMELFFPEHDLREEKHRVQVGLACTTKGKK